MCKQKSLFYVHLTLKITPHPGERAGAVKAFFITAFYAYNTRGKFHH